MKKIVIIALLLLLVAAMVFGPMMKGGDSSTSVEPAHFGFKDNLATKWNEMIELPITIASDDIEKLELFYNDSLFKSWTEPTKKLTFQFNAGYYGLGARPISLICTLKDGTITEDNRIVRVLSDIKPQIWTAKVVKNYPHMTEHYTQGLEFNAGKLYESTGQYGRSMVAEVDLQTGKVNPNKHIKLDENYFGEGLTILGDKIYQLTWKEQKCFVYDKNTFHLIKEFSYNGEGWGLCNDGTSLIMSDGSERITYRNPSDFSIERTIEVYDDRSPIQLINELEYMEGKIYANLYSTDKMVVVEPANGKVIAFIDGSEVEHEGRGIGEVMNGIAFDPSTNKLFMTGKDWEKLMEVRIDKP